MYSNISEIQSDNSCNLNKAFLNNFGNVMVLIFYAEHNEQSKQVLEHINNCIPTFGTYENVKYFRISAEKCPEIFKKFHVDKTPTVIFTQTDKKILYRCEDDNIDIGELFDLLTKIADEHKVQFEKDKVVWHPKVKNMVQSCPFIVFIKGTPENPKCGFTRSLLQILKDNEIEYTFYDIIEDEQMRYWTREYSGWPTFPQVFINGKLIGGLDVTKQLIQKGEFNKLVPQSCRKGSPQEKYNHFVKEHQTVVFVNGFTFENEESKTVVEAAQKKYGDGVTLFNFAVDKNLKEYITEKVSSKIPFIVHNQQIVHQ